MYNEAVRKNNHLNMMAARAAFIPHRDMCQQEQYSPELLEYMNKTESFSVSGVENRGQGADNHTGGVERIKSFLPPGVPSDDTWLRVSKNANFLSSIKDFVRESAGISIKTTSKKVLWHYVEMTMMRRELRSKPLDYDRIEVRKMTSILGE